ncbi:3-dehydroquinate synthase II [Paraliobacillus sediminis]|uniref:3-dehydroquinate synthase II n=1 Tax=Paraliobacillus sediminis TaxID=1885916 RepID=UPI000E3EE17A|nr:3-dehydroquinate synthase II [Paraliobacillus sediminis]
MESLAIAEVISVTPIGMGTRVCLDVIDQLAPSEGIFVGNTGNGYLLVLSENRSTNTYPPRPFRMNGGAIHQYLHLDEGKTTYLSEVKPGLEVPIWQGNEVRKVAVGRVKVEKRPFLRVVCQVEGTEQEISATLQEADSVHVLTADGQAKAVLDLEKGDRITCYPDQPGRHLGEKIDEEISEY